MLPLPSPCKSLSETRQEAVHLRLCASVCVAQEAVHLRVPKDARQYTPMDEVVGREYRRREYALASSQLLPSRSLFLARPPPAPLRACTPGTDFEVAASLPPRCVSGSSATPAVWCLSLAVSPL
jgi:hypothetical protein